jgi:hypothetical protein
MLLTLQVADARAEFERLSSGGPAIAYPLHDEPWGQRRFAVYDPAGTWVDVVEQIDPAPGFWDEYLSSRTARSRASIGSTRQPGLRGTTVS